MKLIIHGGLPKTGTTSLQKTLEANRDVLREAGVLYPEGHSFSWAHHILFDRFTTVEEQHPRFLEKFNGDKDALRKASEQNWQEIQREVERFKPKCLVLSTERLKGLTDSDLEKCFESFRSDFTSDISVCVYERPPTEFCRSLIQQMSSALLADYNMPKRLDHSLFYQRLQAQIGDKFRVRSCVRKDLFMGDVFRDFFSQYLEPFANYSDLKELDAQNVSESAEISCIAFNYGLAVYKSRSKQRVKQLRRMKRNLMMIEARNFTVREGDDKPRLKASVQHAAYDLARHLPWLEEHKGIVFPKPVFEEIEGKPFRFDNVTNAEDFWDNLDQKRMTFLKTKAVKRGLMEAGVI